MQKERGSRKFRIAMRTAKVLIALCLVVSAFLVLVYSGTICVTSASRPKDMYDGEVSVSGAENPVLAGALSYVETHPKYKSKYYEGGYPDDGYGVCTDVVAFAMKSAGMDLMQLVADDVAANPDEYDIETPDANIDFRRVRNLKVWFANNAESLTTDPADIAEWQGGDIVIFEGHIGVVSDRRNERGVTYVIHHNDPFQRRYEQDILEKRNDIVGHYRLDVK